MRERAHRGPARRRYVVDMALPEQELMSTAAVTARQGARPTAPWRCRVPPHDACRRHRRVVAAQRRHHFADRRLAAGDRDFRLRLPGQRAVESGHREVRRAAGDLRHCRHVAHRHADRGAGRPDDRFLSHRAVPAMAAAADRHRHRTARRHPQHHLRHLGTVRLRPVPAGDAAAVPDQHARQRAGHRAAVRRTALRHRHADRRD